MDSIKINTSPGGSDSGEKLEPSDDKGAKKELFSTLGIIIIAPILAILLTVFVFQSYQVDGPSMEQTLHDKDRLIVTKTGKTWAKLTGNDYIPSRYSIIVFNYNGQSDLELQKKQLIKRVIGLPGDHIVIKDGIVTIYNKDNPNGFYPDKLGPESATVNTTKGTEIDQTIKDGEVFVMGDNRDNSLDSRAFGTVRSQDIIGHLSVRIYPFSAIKKF